MDLLAKIKTIPTSPGCYLYKNAEGEVIYVGKAKNLRSRVRSYFLEANQVNNRKTGSLMREAVDIEYITVDNEREALALENNLIKQRKPRFNILLRDDKTYPYIKLTMNDRHPKVFVTRKLRKDGGAYFGPYFPGNLAHRLVDLIHRSFLIPSCKVDLNRYHPRACLQYYIKRCLGPCVDGFVSLDQYKETVRDVQMFLDGRTDELERKLTKRMETAAEEMQFEAAARLRDQIVTVHQMQDKQRIATAENEDADVFGFHYENEMLAVNLFHMRGGKIVDRRDFFWEDLPEFLDTTLNEGSLDEVEPNPNYKAPEIGEGADDVQRGSVTDLGSAEASHPARSSPRCSNSFTLISPTFRAPSTCPSTSKTAPSSPSSSPNARNIASKSPPRNAAKNARSSTSSARTPSSRTTSASACLRPRKKLSKKPCRTLSRLPNFPSASSASTSRTSRAPRRSPPWSCGKMAR